ncbi:PREDICTED: endogenous retrovirus group K member 25 Pol protein-like, partial [Ficedula albicollis]|uniref:endogenous retrovirus group K member 25 Pol protein-like n=1 Tax=Ficedula albicollis TaxID=59894 RepID=UPI0007AD8AE8
QGLPTVALIWKMDDPVWVPQWPLTAEKIQALTELIQQQLKQGHLRPSFSPWNTPCFVKYIPNTPVSVIKKKSGKWRFLHDLRRVNKVMKTMGALQPGLPSPAALPKEHHLLIIDIKDCFFSIPLAEKDKEQFAFSVPEVNNAGPVQRYEWTVLPQGMKNSPTICQWYVNQALQPWKKRHPYHIVYHYMDDILICSKKPLTENEEKDLCNALQKYGLYIAPEKIQ